MSAHETRAFAPGRVNLIGEHTDYNRGLALPCAIAEGVTVRARAVTAGGGATPAGDLDPNAPNGSGTGDLEPDAANGPGTGDPAAASGPRIVVRALDQGEEDSFALPAPPRSDEWRAYVRGVVAEMCAAGVAVPAAEVEIAGDVPRGAGLSSSAALEVALALALLALAGAHLEGRALARLCARVEHEWVGAHTGLLDQLASIYGQAGHAVCIDFADLALTPVPLPLTGGWRLVTLDSGEPRALSNTGYNARRAECARACALLGVASLRELEGEREEKEKEKDPHRGGREGDATHLSPNRGTTSPRLARLPEPLARRVAHVLGENARVRACVAALRAGDLPRVGTLLDASHASLRDLYECSTPAVEAAVGRLRAAGAVGARMVGGGFGGHVLGLLPPGVSAPAGAREVRPSRGAHLLAPAAP